ncbi:tripartite tricarboxylate transporter permease [Streptomyces xinghaiensis]|uniref:Tripartite tricarboxylate transporter permease n=4 Tax=Streptomyces TaxID=1883 RepID=A0A3R7LMF8_9ACTN|nr:tripartite tricarboxylate transporter permease [Streptomyces xinghaiensis]PQM21835.1 transporter [Streptomyces xinghaiensis]RKM93267.1 tripartite tricarboxylate transporter permease [Streptomyces xinghaiensis]RNC71135.1 tripartite tricarboxylate transporter permease [Streptomyces xinghaiensis]
MDTFDQLLYGFGVALSPENLAFVFLGCLIGTVIGMLPGLGPISAISLMIPVAFTLDPASAIIMLAGVYYGAIFGGSTSSILLNAPGVAGTVATSFDGYPMARKGAAGKALAIAAFASFTGGTVGVIGLMLVAPSLSALTVSFGPAEYFALMVLGLTAVVSLSGQNLTKGLVSATVGVMIALVGIDSQTSTLRFTFGRPELYEGVQFLIVALGVFALAEVFVMVLRRGRDTRSGTLTSLRLNRREVRRMSGPTGRGSVLGFLVGVLPGAGATVASFLAYSFEKRIAKDGDTFGQGNIKGVAAPESANNGAAVGSFVPLMTLGVPGSGTTAVLLGALLVLGVQPGPLMLEERPEIFWGVVASMYVGNLVLLILNLPLIPLFAKVLRTPQTLLVPLIVVFCVVGVYGQSFSVFDLWLLTGFGVLGFLMRSNGFPAAPLILGLILGGLMERSMRQALLISSGDFGTFLTKPISAALLAVAALSLLGSVAGPWRRRAAARRAVADGAPLPAGGPPGESGSEGPAAGLAAEGRGAEGAEGAEAVPEPGSADSEVRPEAPGHGAARDPDAFMGGVTSNGTDRDG